MSTTTKMQLQAVDLQRLVRRVGSLLKLTDGHLRRDIDPADYEDFIIEEIRDTMTWSDGDETEAVRQAVHRVMSKVRGNMDNEIEGEFRSAEAAIRDSLNDNCPSVGANE